MYNPDGSVLRTITFKGGGHKLGLKCKDWKSGIITKISDHSKASEKGLQIGWKIESVNGKPYTKKLLIKAALRNEKFKIIFKIDAEDEDSSTDSDDSCSADSEDSSTDSEDSSTDSEDSSDSSSYMHHYRCPPPNPNIISENSFISKLKDLRKILMKDLGWRAYCIYDNKMISEIVKKKPKNLEELIQIKGIGVTKCNTFGKEILEIMNPGEKFDHIENQAKRVEKNIHKHQRRTQKISSAKRKSRKRTRYSSESESSSGSEDDYLQSLNKTDHDRIVYELKQLSSSERGGFGDLVLNDLIKKKPKSVQELLLVYGFGKHNIVPLGKKILQIMNPSKSYRTRDIKDFMNSSDFELHVKNANKSKLIKVTGELGKQIQEWRNKLARKLGKLPFHIFSNRLLMSIADSRPMDLNALEKVPGMRNKIYITYGTTILDIIKQRKSRKRTRYSSESESSSNSEDEECIKIPPKKKIQKIHHREVKECVICLDKERSHVFSKCGHLCVCVDCSRIDQCPLCRQISKCIKVYGI